MTPDPRADRDPLATARRLSPDLLHDLYAEMQRQEREYPNTMPHMLVTSLGEELGEVCRALGRDVPLADEHGALNELLQLAAVAMRGYAALLRQHLDAEEATWQDHMTGRNPHA